jgi:hypothetical protein
LYLLYSVEHINPNANDKYAGGWSLQGMKCLEKEATLPGTQWERRLDFHFA